MELGRVHVAVENLDVVNSERRRVRLYGLDFAFGDRSRIADIVPKKGATETVREAEQIQHCVV